jgi:RND family efflux transporter MFP subunit
VESVVEVLGKSKLVNEQKLRFNQEGKVVAVFFNIGDKVEKDQPLAQLDTSMVMNEVRQSELRVKTAQNNLDKLYQKDKSTERLKIQNQIETAKRQIETAKKEYENLVQDQNEKIQDAQDNLTQSAKESQNKKSDIESNQEQLVLDLDRKQKDYDLKKTDFELSTKIIVQDRANDEHNLESKLAAYQKEIDTAWYGLRADVTDVENHLDSVNAILGAESDKPPRSPEFTNQYFSARNRDYKNRALDAYSDARDALRKYRDSLDKGTKDVSSIIQLLSEEKQMYGLVQSAADSMYSGLENSIDNPIVSVSEVSSMKSSMSSIRSAAINKSQAIDIATTNIRILDTPDMIRTKFSQDIEKREQSYVMAQSELEKMKDDLEKTKADISIKQHELSLGADKLSLSLSGSHTDLVRLVREQDMALSSKNQSIATLEQSLAESRQDLKDLDKAPEAEEVENAKNEIKLAQIALDQSQEKLKNYTLFAPFSGVVRKSDIKTGDNLTTNTESYIYMENPDLVEVIASMDQVDVVKIKRNQQATVRFDAFPEDVFTGSISEIDSNPKDDSGNSGGGGGNSINYDVHVVIERQQKSIYSRMTASTTIVINSSKNTLVVPSTSIIKDENGIHVNKIVDGKKTLTPVTIGLSDGVRTEILSGLREGDKIVEVNFSGNTVQMPTDTVNAF